MTYKYVLTIYWLYTLRNWAFALLQFLSQWTDLTKSLPSTSARAVVM